MEESNSNGKLRTGHHKGCPSKGGSLVWILTSMVERHVSYLQLWDSVIWSLTARGRSFQISEGVCVETAGGGRREADRGDGGRASLCSPSWPGTFCVHQAGLKLLRGSPASACQVLGIKVHTPFSPFITAAQLHFCSSNEIILWLGVTST